MMSILKQKKMSETPFRKEVLAIFDAYHKAIPMSVIESELADYNRITLYRTIKAFIEKGVIHEISISGEDTHYALCEDSCQGNHQHHHQHVHFKCNKCSGVFCVEIDQFPSIKLPHYQVEQLEIQASGLCEKCA